MFVLIVDHLHNQSYVFHKNLKPLRWFEKKLK